MGDSNRVVFMLQFFRFSGVVGGIVNTIPQIPEPFRAGHEVADLPGLGELMGEAGVATVVQQAAKPDGLGQVIDGIELAQAEIGLLTQLPFPKVSIDHGPEHPCAHMHHPDAVQETGMRGAGENQTQNVVLADVSQALKQWMVNHLDFVPVERDTAMHRVHDQFVIGSEQIINGTSHGYNSPKMMIAALLYHRGMPE